MMGIELGPEVTRGHHPPFGDPLTFPTRAGSIVLATRGPGGLKPFDLVLPHQVYVHRVEQLLERGPAELWVLEVTTPWHLLAYRSGYHPPPRIG